MDSATENTILADLRSGRADWKIRVVLSLASAAALAGLVLLVLAIYDTAAPPIQRNYTLSDGTTRIYIERRIGDEEIAVALGLAAFLWCGALVWLWGSYRRFRTGLRTSLVVFGLAVGATVLSVLLDAAVRQNEELWIAACLLIFGSAILGVLTRAWHRHGLARRVVARGGEVNVHCPDCGYSMVGLHDARCPECGARFTLDELIRAQGYGQVRGTTGGAGLIRAVLRSASRADQVEPDDPTEPDAQKDKPAHSDYGT